jgi:DNA-binding MarR family transcriptional regulator
MKDSEKRTPAGAAVSELIVVLFRLNGRLLVSGDRLRSRRKRDRPQNLPAGAGETEARHEPVARLARNMGLNRQGVQRIVGELAAEGFVELKDNPHHRSAKLVVMTAKGLKAFDAAMRLQTPWVNMLGEGFDAKSIEKAGRVLEELRQRLERSAADAADD